MPTRPGAETDSILIRATLRAIWHYSHAIQFRFFQYYEFYLLKRGGAELPRWLLREIWKRPGQSEDWIQLARFLHPDEPILLIDIGANVGDFTADFLKIYSRQWSNYAFERDVIFVRKHLLSNIWFDNYGLSKHDRESLR